jgi:LPS export ABC transporter protein LptC
MALNRGKNIQLALFFIILLVIGIVLAVFIGYRTVSNSPEMILKAVQKDADISVQNVSQVSTKNGIKEWRLNAASAKFLEPDKKAVFSGLSVVFYLKNGKTLDLSADTGTLYTVSRDISVEGNVTANDGLVTIQTETLRYTHERNALVADTPVKIVGDTFRLSADSAAVDLNTQITTFRGNVEGIIFENITM